MNQNKSRVHDTSNVSLVPAWRKCRVGVIGNKESVDCDLRQGTEERSGQYAHNCS